MLFIISRIIPKDNQAMFCQQRKIQNQMENGQQLLSKLAEIINQLYHDAKSRVHLNPLKWLDQVQFVVFKRQGDLDDTTKCSLEDLACDHCGALTKNVLLLLIHLGITHDNEKFNYEISEDNQCLSIFKQAKMSKKDSLAESNNNIILYHSDYFQRLSQILISTLSKITRSSLPLVKTTAFYHSTDIFKEIANDSDSQAENFDVIYKHQTKKLIQFNDISKSQIKFYYLWNEFIHNLKKNMKSGVFSREYVVNNLRHFVICRQLSGLRIQLITHLNALWCYGVIDSNQVIYRLLDFDKAQIETKVQEK